MHPKTLCLTRSEVYPRSFDDEEGGLQYLSVRSPRALENGAISLAILGPAGRQPEGLAIAKSLDDVAAKR